MSDHGHVNGRGTFSCKIDGRAGYLRIFDDRLELVRSGRGPQALGAEVIPLHLITAVTTGRPGRLLTAVELVAGGGYLEIKLPSIDAPRVAELIETLAAAAAPVAMPDHSIFSAPVVVEPVPVEAVEPRVFEPLDVEPERAEFVVADFVMPDFSMQVDMPEWTPLAEEGEVPAAVDATEIVSQREYVAAAVEMPEWRALPETDDVTEPEPESGPPASVLAAAAALAELEHMLADIPAPSSAVAVPSEPQESDVASIPVQATETVLAPERQTELPPDLRKRLDRLEVLRNSGIMTETDFAIAEAELYESALSEPQTA